MQKSAVAISMIVKNEIQQCRHGMLRTYTWDTFNFFRSHSFSLLYVFIHRTPQPRDTKEVPAHSILRMENPVGSSLIQDRIPTRDFSVSTKKMGYRYISPHVSSDLRPLTLHLPHTLCPRARAHRHCGVLWRLLTTNRRYA